MKKKYEIIKNENIFFVAHNKWMMDNFKKNIQNTNLKYFYANTIL